MIHHVNYPGNPKCDDSSETIEVRASSEQAARDWMAMKHPKFLFSHASTSDSLYIFNGPEWFRKYGTAEEKARYA